MTCCGEGVGLAPVQLQRTRDKLLLEGADRLLRQGYSPLLKQVYDLGAEEGEPRVRPGYAGVAEDVLQAYRALFTVYQGWRTKPLGSLGDDAVGILKQACVHYDAVRQQVGAASGPVNAPLLPPPGSHLFAAPEPDESVFDWVERVASQFVRKAVAPEVQGAALIALVGLVALWIWMKGSK